MLKNYRYFYILIILSILVSSCDRKDELKHNLPKTHPVIKIQKRLEDIIKYTKDAIVKVTKADKTPIIYDFSNIDYRDLVIGSGFVFKKDKEYLYILTNNHVVEKSKKLKITFFNQYEKEAEIVGVDKATDLAVLKVKIDENIKDIKPLEFDTTEHLKEGDFILVAGVPYNLTLSYSFGIVSSLHVNPGISEFEDYIQVNASINPGNSGGPVFDIYGYVIGVVVATVQYGQGIGFVIPVEKVLYVTDEILRYGKVRRGWIGVIVENAKELVKQNMETKGVLIIAVQKNSPARRAGLKAGDVILKVKNKDVKNVEVFRDIEAKLKPNEVITITILRGGKTIVIPLKVGENKKVE